MQTALWSAYIFLRREVTTKFRRSKREKQKTQHRRKGDRYRVDSWPSKHRCYCCHSATVFPLYNQLLYSIRTSRSIRACVHTYRMIIRWKPPLENRFQRVRYEFFLPPPPLSPFFEDWQIWVVTNCWHLTLAVSNFWKNFSERIVRKALMDDCFLVADSNDQQFWNRNFHLSRKKLRKDTRV